MQGEYADLIFTDPPYGVNYVGKTKDALTIQNDALGDDGTRELVADILTVAPLREGGVFYVCSPAGNTETAFRLAIQDAGLSLRQCLCWVKQQFVLGRQDYHWRHESILYGWREGAAHYFVDDRTQDTVWEIDRPSRNDAHPTMKPIALVAKAIANSSRLHEIVYDACGGSGTTLIASDQLNRHCRMVEIDPRYCDVILTRWEQLTGRHAELLERITPDAD
jgi:DNA modification methylase